MNAVAAAVRHARARKHVALDRLSTLIRYPTVSSDCRHQPDLRACAWWLASLLTRIGLTDVRVWPGRVAPVVTGAWFGRAGLPTVLVYGHYDVQPPGPYAAWATDPFVPSRVGCYVRGRGASDDKGQLLAHLTAIEAWLATSGRLPLNLRLVLDGEEEIGSPTLLAAVARGWAPLNADAALVADTWMLAPNRPVLISALRGALRARLEVSGPQTDLHSGAFGGAVSNPASALAHLVGSLITPKGRVAAAGFYEDVCALTDEERIHLARVGPSDARLLVPAGVVGVGETGFSAFERVTRRPAIVVTDLRTSSGGRSVVPAWAAADITVRLTPAQRPTAIGRVLRQHIRTRMPPGVHGRLRVLDRCPPYVLDPHAPVVRAARMTCRKVFGRDPVLLPSGGSIPFVSTLAAASQIDIALFGFGLPTDRPHAPNERFHVPNLFRGTEACIVLYEQMARELDAPSRIQPNRIS